MFFYHFYPVNLVNPVYFLLPATLSLASLPIYRHLAKVRPVHLTLFNVRS
jgi:hypothetical protein